MAHHSIRLAAAGGAVAFAFALFAAPCMAQALVRSQHGGSAAGADWANDELDSQDIVAPASSRGLRLQSEADEQAEQAILAALARPVSVKFDNTPLREVRQSFRSQLGVNILIDTKDLTDAGVSDDTLFTFSASYLSARTALDEVLKQKELDWLIEGGALIITTSDVAKSRTETRVYPVADLTLGADTNGSYAYEFDSLIELITSIVAPASWDSNGGAGSVAPYAESGALVFSQTREIHEQVAMLLDKLRLVRHVQGLDVGLRLSRERLGEGASFGNEAANGGAYGGAFSTEQEASPEPQAGNAAVPQPSANLSMAQPPLADAARLSLNGGPCDLF